MRPHLIAPASRRALAFSMTASNSPKLKRGVPHAWRTNGASACRAADHEVDGTLAAGRASQPARPIDDGGVDTVPSDLGGNVGLGPVAASLAPHDQPDLGIQRTAQRHRHGLALAALAPHNPAMPRPLLTDDDNAILIELLRETIERDRFPFSPRIKSLKAVLDKLAPPAPQAEPLPPPQPP